MGNKALPKGFVPGVCQEPKLNSFQKHEITQRLIEYILKGEPRSMLHDVIQDCSPVQLSQTGKDNMVEFAQQWLCENVQMDAQEIITLHTIYYEQMYAYFLSIGHVEGQNKAMKSKERLFGLHRETKSVTINKKTNINIMQAAEYDNDKLNPEEKKRFEFLMNKATA